MVCIKLEVIGAPLKLLVCSACAHSSTYCLVVQGVDARLASVAVKRTKPTCSRTPECGSTFRSAFR